MPPSWSSGAKSGPQDPDTSFPHKQYTEAMRPLAEATAHHAANPQPAADEGTDHSGSPVLAPASTSSHTAKSMHGHRTSASTVKAMAKAKQAAKAKKHARSQNTDVAEAAPKCTLRHWLRTIGRGEWSWSREGCCCRGDNAGGRLCGCEEKRTAIESHGKFVSQPEVKSSSCRSFHRGHIIVLLSFAHLKACFTLT